MLGDEDIACLGIAGEDLAQDVAGAVEVMGGEGERERCHACPGALGTSCLCHAALQCSKAFIVFELCVGVGSCIEDACLVLRVERKRTACDLKAEAVVAADKRTSCLGGKPAKVRRIGKMLGKLLLLFGGAVAHKAGAGTVCLIKRLLLVVCKIAEVAFIGGELGCLHHAARIGAAGVECERLAELLLCFLDE